MRTPGHKSEEIFHDENMFLQVDDNRQETGSATDKKSNNLTKLTNHVTYILQLKIPRQNGSTSYLYKINVIPKHVRVRCQHFLGKFVVSYKSDMQQLNSSLLLLFFLLITVLIL